MTGAPISSESASEGIVVTISDVSKLFAAFCNNPRLRSLLYDLYQNEARLLAATQQIQAQTNQRNVL